MEYEYNENVHQCNECVKFFIMRSRINVRSVTHRKIEIEK